MLQLANDGCEEFDICGGKSWDALVGVHSWAYA